MCMQSPNMSIMSSCRLTFAEYMSRMVFIFTHQPLLILRNYEAEGSVCIIYVCGLTVAKSSGCTIYGALGRWLWLFRSMLVTHIHIQQHCKCCIAIRLAYFSHPEICHPAHSNFAPSAALFQFYRFLFSRSQQLSHSPLPSCTGCSLNFRFLFESRCDGHWQAPLSLIFCSLAAYQSCHLWASELLALIARTPCEQEGLCSYKCHFLKNP